jgi:hypothetical protein
MPGRIYVQSICFLGLLTLFGVYLGYSGQIYPVTSLLAIVISAILSWKFTGGIKTEKVENWKILSSILFLFLVIEIYPLLPDLIFPHGAGDFQNHARSVRIVAKEHSLQFFQASPQIYYGIGAMFYSLFPHTYVINSIFSILLELLSSIGVFLVARKLYTEKIGLIAMFIYAFALTNLFILEQGFFPQILAQFFFISSIYLFLVRRNALLILANIGLLAHPHYFGVYLIFLFFELVRTREWKILLVPFVSLFVLVPEVFSLLGGRASLISEGKSFKTHITHERRYTHPASSFPGDLFTLPYWLLVYNRKTALPVYQSTFVCAGFNGCNWSDVCLGCASGLDQRYSPPVYTSKAILSLDFPFKHRGCFRR